MLGSGEENISCISDITWKRKDRKRRENRVIGAREETTDEESP